MNHDEEIFIWSGIFIRQQKDVFKIGTDAILLGTWIPKVIPKANHILDAGTGTGILSLMMAYFFQDALITAIDQVEAAVSLSEHNFKNSLWPDRVASLHQNILDPLATEHQTYDLILCNPPFFYKQLGAGDEVKTKAKHADASTRIWMRSLSGKMKTSGHICVVVPYASAVDWITSANETGFYCHHRLDVFSFPDDPVAVRSLLHFHKDLVKPEIKRLDIYESLDHFSEAYLDFSKISQRDDRIKKQDQKQ